MIGADLEAPSDTRGIAAVFVLRSVETVFTCVFS